MKLARWIRDFFGISVSSAAEEVERIETKAAEEPVQKNKPKALSEGQKYIQLQKMPNNRFANDDRMVRWMVKDKDGAASLVRTPREKVHKSLAAGGFCVAGKYYTNMRQLTKRTVEEGSRRYQDIYGRDVIEIRERFPCFDSHDFLHENRYYRWFYLIENEMLYCVYYEDEGTFVTVTKDVARISSSVYKVMHLFGQLDESDILCIG